jgi:hypothetical protein
VASQKRDSCDPSDADEPDRGVGQDPVTSFLLRLLVDHIRRLVASGVSEGEQSRCDTVAVRLIEDQNAPESVASRGTEESSAARSSSAISSDE